MDAVSAESLHLQPGGWDSVTVSFATADAGICGMVRHGLAPSGNGGATASSLAVLFVGGKPQVLVAAGGVGLDQPSWQALEVGGLRTAVAEPLERWTIGGLGLDLAVTAIAPAACVPGEVGGLAGYEQLVRVQGAVEHDGATLPLDALGQRGHGWGAPDWDRLEAVRTASFWLGDRHGATVTAARSTGAEGHERDEIWGAVWDGDGPQHVAEPRLSTTYDGDGRQRRAGLELWLADPHDDDHVHARRAAGHAVCGSTLELGRLRLDCAFMRWTAEGESGVGRYDLLRRRD